MIPEYGSWVEKNYGKKYMGIDRSTFLIDKNGIIKNIWRKVRVKGHIDKVIEEIEKNSIGSMFNNLVQALIKCKSIQVILIIIQVFTSCYSDAEESELIIKRLSKEDLLDEINVYKDKKIKYISIL